MNAELVCTGTELLLGQILNGNARYLSERLSALGINVYFHTTVGDNEERISEAIMTALERADLVITTGGLGPTQDDITKETVAKILGLDMLCDDISLQKIESFFSRRGTSMPQVNRKQAFFPAGSIIIPNNMGTAPGAIVEYAGKVIVILPGPPNENQPMFEEFVEPYLQKKTGQAKIIKSRILRLFGIGESTAQEKLNDIFQNQSNPSLAFNFKPAELHIRITAKAASHEEADNMMDETETLVRSRVGEYIFGVDDQTLEMVVGKLLKEHNLTVSMAESCTGGMIATRLTEVPGSSQYVQYGVVTYSNQAKETILEVKPQTLSEFGAVSEETAKEMAEGVRRIKNTDIGISVTGIAGPDGGTEEKPVGLVYIGLSTPEETLAQEFIFAGNRQSIRLRASSAALNIIRKYIIEKKTH